MTSDDRCVCYVDFGENTPVSIDMIINSRHILLQILNFILSINKTDSGRTSKNLDDIDSGVKWHIHLCIVYHDIGIAIF